MKLLFLFFITFFYITSCSDNESNIIKPTINDTNQIIDTTIDSSLIDTTTTKDTSTSTPINKEIVYDDTTVIFDSRDSNIIYPIGSPVEINGKLQVIGTQLCNESGIPIQLRGMSSMGLQWAGEYMNPTLFDTLAYDWGVDIIRIAVYVGEGGYMHMGTSIDNSRTDSLGRKELRDTIDQLVYEIGKRGMYCLIDWHTLSPGNPWLQYEAGLEFWKYMGKKHANKTHVLFEIFNEPNKNNNPPEYRDVKWSNDNIDKDLKSLAEIYIPIIRKYDTDKSIVIVGNPGWSSMPEIVKNNMLTYDNIMYTFHYYTDLHGSLSAAKKANLLTVPVFVTEWGWGNSATDIAYAKSFIDWASVHKISWIKWAIQAGDYHSIFIKDIPEGPYYNNYNFSGLFVRWNIKYPIDNFTGGHNNSLIIKKEIIGNGSINITPDKPTYNYGDTVTIEAIPDEGMEFSEWLIDTLSTSSKLKFRVDNSSIFKAIFKQVGNYLINGNFDDGIIGWELIEGSNANMEIDLSEDNAKINTISASPLTKISTLTQKELTLNKGTYILSFDCSSSKDRLINATIKRNYGQTPPVFLEEDDISISNTVKTYNFEFEVTNDPNKERKDVLAFEIGKYDGDIIFDNISIKLKK